MVEPAEIPRLQSGSKLPHSIPDGPSHSTVPARVPWPHAPTHRLAEAGTYIVTAATYRKALLFTDGRRLRMLQTALLTLAAEFAWQLEAWAVFPNHYHFVGHSPAQADSLVRFLRTLHSRTAIALNRTDRVEGRQVWQNYFDTRLTHERSYLARLNYVHHNAVHHGLVAVANHYPWCSAAWFEQTATTVQVKTIYGLKTDQVNVPDFEVPRCG